MVSLASRRSTPRKVATTEIKAYSNCAEVVLTVNGRSFGTQDRTKSKSSTGRE